MYSIDTPKRIVTKSLYWTALPYPLLNESDLHVSLEEGAERLLGHVRGDEHGGIALCQVHQAQPAQLIRLQKDQR